MNVLPNTSRLYWYDPANVRSYKAPSSRQILRIALNLKYLIDTVIPIAYDEKLIVCDHSRIINARIIRLAREACGGERECVESVRKYESVLVFALLKVCSWYWDLAGSELHNAELYACRATTAQQLGKLIIEKMEQMDLHYTFIQVLLRRYQMSENDIDTVPTSALEMAVDNHCTIVIGASGYQRCLKWLWRGWIVQNRYDPHTFVLCDIIPSCQPSVHFTPNRLKAPIYQNMLQILFSMIYLLLYTMVVNQKDDTVVKSLDSLELCFYFFTIGHTIDEVVKIYHVGWAYIGFWNVCNDFMFSVIITSIVCRFLSLCPYKTSLPRENWDILSYRILACAAPLVWSRLLLYLESNRFVGALLVVLTHMMRESIYFFVLLLLVMVGFIQGFLGLDSADGKREITWPILSNLMTTTLGFGDFEMFEKFAPPYAAILYYGYCFIVTIILLNILIALYSSAYQKVIDNATEEYLALMAQKTLRYIRAPDEDVYVPPLNIIELLISLTSWVLPKSNTKFISHCLMKAIFSPILCYIAIKETIQARRIVYNRLKKLPDDSNEVDVAWDFFDGFIEEEVSIFDTDISSGALATKQKNKRSIRLQREAEAVDPKFRVKKSWYSEVKASVQPVEKGFESGIGWESYEVYDKLRVHCANLENKIQILTDMVTNLTSIVTELEKKER